MASRRAQGTFYYLYISSEGKNVAHDNMALKEKYRPKEEQKEGWRKVLSEDLTHGPLRSCDQRSLSLSYV